MNQLLHLIFLRTNLRMLIIALAVLWSWTAVAWGNDSIPFLYRSHLYLPACINNEHQANVIFDTGAASIFGIDSVYFSASDWHPQDMGRAEQVAVRALPELKSSWTPQR